MKLLMPRNELKFALTGLARIVKTKASLPVLSHIRLDAAPSSVRLTGTDLEQTVTCEMPVESVNEPLTCLLPIEALQGVLKTTQGPDIEISPISDAEILLSSTVSGQAIQRRIQTLSVDDWPSLPVPAQTRTVEPLLLDHIRQTMTFASTDDSRYVLKGVYLDVADKNCHKVVATDGRRLTVLNSVRLPIEQSVIVPSSKFLGWSRLSGETRIGLDAQHELLTLAVGPWTYVSKLTSGTFPNYQQVIPATEGTTRLNLTTEDRDLLIQAIPGLSSGDTLVLELTPESIRVTAGGQAAGDANTVALERSTCTGRPIRIGLNRTFLREALVAGFTRFALYDPDSPVVGRLSEDDRHSVHVLMPVRIAETKPSKPEATETSPPAVSKAVPPVPLTPNHEEKTMPKEDAPRAEATSLDRILEAYETAKTAVRQANAALADVATYVREAIKEDKARRREIADVRAGLAKLQSIKV